MIIFRNKARDSFVVSATMTTRNLTAFRMATQLLWHEKNHRCPNGVATTCTGKATSNNLVLSHKSWQFSSGTFSGENIFTWKCLNKPKQVSGLQKWKLFFHETAKRNMVLAKRSYRLRAKDPPTHSTHGTAIQYTVKKPLADFAVYDGWRYCKTIWDEKFRQTEGSGKKFSHIELSIIASSVKFSSSVDCTVSEPRPAMSYWNRLRWRGLLADILITWVLCCLVLKNADHAYMSWAHQEG